MGLQLELLGIPYVILDRQPEPGGTWSINRYPDIRVDTISITYEFAFEKNYPWSEYFGRGAEVREYLEPHRGEVRDGRRTLRFGRNVKQADVRRGPQASGCSRSTPPTAIETFEANVIVNAVGAFTNPNYPHFEGEESFEGPMLHPARWPADFDLTGKRIAIVGNGSTGVQLLAPIAAEAEQVYVFQRTPQWISPRPKYGEPVEPEIRWLLDNFPGYWNWWRYMAIAALFQTHGFLDPDEEWKAQGGHVNPLNDKMRDDLTALHQGPDRRPPGPDRQADPRLRARSRAGPVVDNGWYRSLTRDNVELVTDPIARLTPKGVETGDGTVREVDAIVTATGFEIVKYLWPADYVGKGGDEHPRLLVQGRPARVPRP